MTRLVSILRAVSLKKVAVWFWRPARRSMLISAVCHALFVLALGYWVIEIHHKSTKLAAPLSASIIDRVETPTEMQAVLKTPQHQSAQDEASNASIGGGKTNLSTIASGGQWVIKTNIGELTTLSTSAPRPSQGPMGLGNSVRGSKMLKVMEVKNPATASFFGATAGGNDFVFVVDLSGSMTGDRFDRAERELERAIKSLYEPQRFYVIFFNQVDFPMPTQGLVPATGLNQRDAIRWFHTAQCGGGTHPLTALQQAVQLKPDAVFFLTDGEFDPAVVTLIQPEGVKPIPIHCIAFASREGEILLKTIAQISGGSYRYVP